MWPLIWQHTYIFWASSFNLPEALRRLASCRLPAVTWISWSSLSGNRSLEWERAAPPIIRVELDSMIRMTKMILMIIISFFAHITLQGLLVNWLRKTETTTKPLLELRRSRRRFGFSFSRCCSRRRRHVWINLGTLLIISGLSSHQPPPWGHSIFRVTSRAKKALSELQWSYFKSWWLPLPKCNGFTKSVERSAGLRIALFLSKRIRALIALLF